MSVVLVTGAAGNLGRRVAERLARTGHYVKAFDLPGLDYAFTEALDNVEVIKGDIRNPSDQARACREVAHAVHLAAVMPPLSEEDHVLAGGVNIEGTRTLMAALAPGVPLVFASSVATYGVPQQEVVRLDHVQKPIDYYGETKLQTEQDILAGGRPFVLVRISGISVPALLEIPRPWFFSRKQPMEFVHLDDAAQAIVKCVGNQAVAGRIIQIAGGRTWRMLGEDYARAVCQTFDLPPDSSTYQERPGWTGWYDTSDSQQLLQYQNHTFEDYIRQLRSLYLEAIGEA